MKVIKPSFEIIEQDENLKKLVKGEFSNAC